MSVTTKKKPVLAEYTAIIRESSCMETYVTHIMVSDINNSTEVKQAIVDYLNDNSGEPDPWTENCFSIESVFEGVHKPVDLSNLSWQHVLANVLGTSQLVREMHLGDDLRVIVCHTVHDTISCFRFDLVGGDTWESSEVITDADYADCMDALVELCTSYDGGDYEYFKHVDDPF